MRKILPLILVLGMISTANAYIVSLSLDGINPTSDSVDVFAGDTFKMYVISDTADQSYGRLLGSLKSNPLAISNVQSYPAAGSSASVSDNSDSSHYRFALEASGVGIEAGKHFSFDVAIDAGAALGAGGRISVTTPLVGDYVDFNIVPEPATVLLFGLGGAVLLRRRRANR
jgi:hypothetical protein